MEKSNKYRHLFSDSEWDHFLKLGAALHDPAEKKEFYSAVIEGKQRDKNYEISGYVPKKKSISSEIITMLDKANKKRMEKEKSVEPEKNKEMEHLSKVMRECILQKLHLPDTERDTA